MFREILPPLRAFTEAGNVWEKGKKNSLSPGRRALSATEPIHTQYQVKEAYQGLVSGA
jgi:hypothetical protein